MTAKTSVVIATGNPHKVAEIRAIFSSEGVTEVTFVGLGETPGGPFPEPMETGNTFVANATIKALAYAKATGRLCLADDSGIEIDALNGLPGVISSHYGSDGVETGLRREERDAANNSRVMRELEGVSTERRSARFVCVMVLADPSGVIAVTRGEFEGRIGLPESVPRGVNGFGYDPFFLVAPAFSQTGAELDPAEKNRRSHRAQASRLMAERLRSLTASR